MDNGKDLKEPVVSQPSGEWNLVSVPSDDQLSKDSASQDGGLADQVEVGLADSTVKVEDEASPVSVEDGSAASTEGLHPDPQSGEAEVLTSEESDSSSIASKEPKKSYLAIKGQTALNFIERTFTSKKQAEAPHKTAQDAEIEEGSSPPPEIVDKKPGAFGEEWPEKAAAFKNFVRDGGKNVVDGGKNVVTNVVDGSKNVVTNVVDGSRTVVSKVIRRLSGKKEDLDRSDETDKEVGIPEEVSKSESAKSENEEDTEAEDEAQDSGREMKGRVTVFSVSGSRECRTAKSILSKWGIKFVEINLDVFPQRKSELEEKAGTLDVPQVFFNDAVIGGVRELLALEEGGQLEEKIEQVFEVEANLATPLPPVYSEHAVSGKLDEYIELVKKLRAKLVVKDRFLKYRVINKCFVGSDAVDIVMEDQHITREMAVELVRSIASKHFFTHVLEEHVFEDGNHFYRFLEHNPNVLGKCLNFSGATNDLEPRPARDVGDDLRKLILAIYDAYVSEDGKHVDYEGIAKGDEFKCFVKKTEELQRVDLVTFSSQEKLAFFLNIYNALVIHAIAELRRSPGGPLLDRRSFFLDVQYVIGGQTYSLSAIENGLLRANRRAPYTLRKPFSSKDPRLQVALSEAEPLIHMALVKGTRSSPALRCYSFDGVLEELKTAANEFLAGSVRIDPEAKSVSISKIFKWYDTDFAKNEVSVLKWIAQYLNPEEEKQLLGLLDSQDIKLAYLPYDWSLNK